ncbi:serine protease 52-like isoform X2 [Leopardus geoffroyi]|uniref:serine protease 52-like isoform X2 n=1 Tax=Leopardus geoffroyi TaxID=46844 RepID=UPI001E263BDF|nr:serine protease 52-like isoform X2 [Leopardus geoffroyi]
MKVDKSIIHPYFDSWFLDNDIALLLLKSPFKLGVKEVPICLSEVNDIQKWRNCWVTGWGITIPMQDTTSRLQKVNIKLVKWETCSHKVPILTRNMLCAGSPQGGKDACQLILEIYRFGLQKDPVTSIPTTWSRASVNTALSSQRSCATML